MTTNFQKPEHSEATRQSLVAIVAVGTEVCAGDIANTNGAWLSRTLTELGYRVKVHLVVEDNHEDILAALAYSEKIACTIFVIGGLGPTSDDFTRDIISKWCHMPLDFSQESWQRVLERFNKLGRQTPESNKQQCFFPRTSVIYQNSNGTADGFSCTKSDVTLFALPGPPTELKGIWRDHLNSPLSQKAPKKNRRTLRTWQCIGQGESFLAEIVEKTMNGSGYEIGYRARFPYVDIKVWIPESDAAKATPFFGHLDAALEEWFVGSNHYDLTTDFAAQLKQFSRVRILDHGTSGKIFLRCESEFFKAGIEATSESTSAKFIAESSLDASTLPKSKSGSNEIEADITLFFHGITEAGSWRISGQTRTGEKFEKTLKSHLRGLEWKERNQTYVAELALLHWNRWLKTL